MAQIVAPQVEQYLSSMNRMPDPVLQAIAAEGRAADLPLIDAEVGALLHILARAVGARRVLEIGTAIGYSGIWLARALPRDGLLISMEIDRDRADQARTNFARAGIGHCANVLVGDAARFLHKVAGPFDLIFNDGDKLQYPVLLDAMIERLRVGGLLVTDNVLWSGEVVPGYGQPPVDRRGQAEAIGTFNERLASDPRLQTSIVPLRDGVSIALRIA